MTGRAADKLGASTSDQDDVWLAKYNSNETQLWVCQLGSPQDEFIEGVIVDRQGNVYISGYTKGTLGSTSAGGQDAFIAYDQEKRVNCFGLINLEQQTMQQSTSKLIALAN